MDGAAVVLVLRPARLAGDGPSYEDRVIHCYAIARDCAAALRVYRTSASAKAMLNDVPPAEHEAQIQSTFAWTMPSCADAGR